MEAINVAIEDAASEATIRCLRPQTSEAEPATISAGAMVRVASESERLAAAGDTSKSLANTGSKGCTL